jgi:hypothetical protein
VGAAGVWVSEAQTSTLQVHKSELVSVVLPDTQTVSKDKNNYRSMLWKFERAKLAQDLLVIAVSVVHFGFGFWIF